VKILHIIPEMNVGGAEKVIFELLLLNNSYVLTFKTNLFDSRIFVNEKKNKWMHFFNIWKTIKNIQPEIINGHMAPTIPYLILLKLFYSKINFFYTVHYNYNKPSKLKDRILHYILFKIVKIKIVSVSKTSDLTLKNDYKNADSILIYNGITEVLKTENFIKAKEHIESLLPNSMTKVFLSVSRIVPVKNLNLLVKVFNRLKEEGQNAILIVIGYDPTENQNELKKLKANAANNIHFIGSKNNVADYLFNSDGFCLSSFSEGLPMALLEAMSCGVPAICTNVGGIPEVITENETGFLSQSSDTNDFYEKIIQFSNLSSDKVNEMKNKCVQLHRTHFTSQIMRSKYKEIYDIR
jgi:glycosyltransferase involved in cell wall biosynthesis